MARLDQNGEGDRPNQIVRADTYQERVVRSRQKPTAALKGKGKPLGGAPPIPPEHTKALAASMAPRPYFGPQEEPEQEAEPQEFRVPQEPPASLGGVGSAYEVNQKMARGELDRPVSMKEAKKMQPAKKPVPKKLSPESVEQLEQAKKRLEEDAERAEEQQAEDRTAAELEEAEEEMLQRDIPFDYDGIQEQQKQLMSDERKAKIEERLEALDIADMIVKREITQDIPVIPGKLIYTLRTYNQQEYLFCLQHIYERPSSVTYAEEFLNTCKLVCSLVAINGAPLPTHMKDGSVDKDLFENKMSHVASFPVHLIADLSVQTIWFNQRVNKLFSVGNLKNG